MRGFCDIFLVYLALRQNNLNKINPTMKRTVLFLLALLGSVSMSHAQNYYPGESGVVEGDGFVYRYEKVTPSLVGLYNSDSRFVGEEMTYDGSTKIPEGMLLYTSLSVTNDEMMALVADQFTVEQKNILAGWKLIIKLRIDPKTGRVADVIFTYANISRCPFTRIPIDVYRRVELALKENMIFTPTAESRRMNYFSFVWPQQF